MGTTSHVAEGLVAMVDNMNSAPPENSVCPPQKQADIPERLAHEDNDADYSSLDEILHVSPRVKAKPPSMPIPKNDPSRLAAGRCFIENRDEALTVPFTQVSDAIHRSLENAEKAKGGPRKVLAKLREVANGQALQAVKDLFDSDVEEIPNGCDENLLECIRRVMMVEATIREASLEGPMEKKGKRAHILTSIPPGGALNVKGEPGESTPAFDQLSIREYSNHAYWKFAPHLEAVRYTLYPTHKHGTDYFRGSVKISRNCTSLTTKASTAYK